MVATAKAEKGERSLRPRRSSVTVQSSSTSSTSYKETKRSPRSENGSQQLPKTRNSRSQSTSTKSPPASSSTKKMPPRRKKKKKKKASKNPYSRAPKPYQIVPDDFVVEHRTSFGDYDCCMGRGTLFCRMPCNLRFKKLLVPYRTLYLTAHIALIKTKVVQYIYDKMRQKGECLEIVEHDAQRPTLLATVPDIRAKEKIMQTLRERKWNPPKPRKGVWNDWKHEAIVWFRFKYEFFFHDVEYIWKEQVTKIRQNLLTCQKMHGKKSTPKWAKIFFQHWNYDPLVDKELREQLDKQMADEDDDDQELRTLPPNTPSIYTPKKKSPPPPQQQAEEDGSEESEENEEEDSENDSDDDSDVDQKKPIRATSTSRRRSSRALSRRRSRSVPLKKETESEEESDDEEKSSESSSSNDSEEEDKSTEKTGDDNGDDTLSDQSITTTRLGRPKRAAAIVARAITQAVAGGSPARPRSQNDHSKALRAMKQTRRSNGRFGPKPSNVASLTETKKSPGPIGHVRPKRVLKTADTKPPTKTMHNSSNINYLSQKRNEHGRFIRTAGSMTRTKTTKRSATTLPRSMEPPTKRSRTMQGPGLIITRKRSSAKQANSKPSIIPNHVLMQMRSPQEPSESHDDDSAVTPPSRSKQHHGQQEVKRRAPSKGFVIHQSSIPFSSPSAIREALRIQQDMDQKQQMETTIMDGMLIKAYSQRPAAIEAPTTLAKKAAWNQASKLTSMNTPHRLSETVATVTPSPKKRKLTPAQIAKAKRRFERRRKWIESLGNNGTIIF